MMNKIKIVIAGPRGRMGSEAVKLSGKNGNLRASGSGRS